MAIERLNQRDLKSHVICLLYRDGKKHFHDGKWRKFEALIEFKGEKFQVNAEYVLRDVFLTYKHLTIERESRIILLN
jgi:hypothetical protein